MANPETYIVVWELPVTAIGYQDAANQARAAMIDPKRTHATFKVVKPSRAHRALPITVHVVDEQGGQP